MAFSLWRVVSLIFILDNLRPDNFEQSTGSSQPAKLFRSNSGVIFRCVFRFRCQKN